LDFLIGAVLFSSYSRPKKLWMALYAHLLRLRFPLENQEGLLRFWLNYDYQSGDIGGIMMIRIKNQNFG